MKTLRQIKRIIIFVIGMTVLLLGIALVALPGPAFLVIPAGLGILAIEFEWARRWLRKARGFIKACTTDNLDCREEPSGLNRWAIRTRVWLQRVKRSLKLSKG
jgi:hypothetical protein